MLTAPLGDLSDLLEELGFLEEDGAAGVLARDAAVHGLVRDTEERHIREIRRHIVDLFAVDVSH